MNDNYDSFSFDHYELIPREQTLRRPLNDQYAYMNSRPYQPIIKNDEVQKLQRQQEAKLITDQIIKQKDSFIEQLKKQVDNLKNLLNVEKQINQESIKIFFQIKEVFCRPDMTNEHIVQQLKKMMKRINQLQNSNSLKNFNQLQQLCIKKQQQIRDLKARLLQSTSNNIIALFDTQISENKCLLQQVASLKQDIHNLNRNQQNKNQLKNGQKVNNLIQKYEQMLELYHKNEKIIYQLKNKEQQNFAYFSSLRAQIKSQIYEACNGYTNSRMLQFEKQIKTISQNVESMHQRPKYDTKHNSLQSKLNQLSIQVQKLKRKLDQKQSQIQKIKQQNKQLFRRSQTFENIKIQSKLSELQQKVKQKDMRIYQLENTIFEHIDSKIRSQSINSQQQDIEKLRNNVRNLKTIIVNLKQQNKSAKQKVKQLMSSNKQLKKMLQNYSSSQQQHSKLVQKVSRDEGTFKVVEDIVSVLINQAETQKKCKCLQKTTDCLLILNQQYPELQQILQGLGVMQKTSNLLPTQI